MKKFLLLVFATLSIASCSNKSMIRSSNSNNHTKSNDQIVTEQNDNTYTIRFLNDGGSVLSSEQYEFGAMPEAPDTPSKENPLEGYTYTFSGWSPSIALVTADADYVATYKAEAKTGEVIWVDGDGKTLLTENYPYGSMPNYHGTMPTKTPTDTETYVFKGWSPEISLVASDSITYTAQFNSVPISTKYFIQINCTDCLVNKKKSINEKHAPLAELTYQFNNTSKETYHYPYALDVKVDGVSTNDFVYNNYTGKLNIKLTGNTVINAVADNSCVLMKYEYSADSPTVEITCDGDFERVDWGDGVVDTNKSHTYSFDPDKDTYDIRVYGKLSDFSIHSKAVVSINIFHSIDTIVQYAFDGCSSLVSITIPNSVTTFGIDSFRNCSSLTIYCEAESAPGHCEPTWNSSRPFYWGYLFSDSTSDFDYVVQRLNGVKQIAISKYLGSSASVTVPEEISVDGGNLPVTSIGGYAFKKSIPTNVDLPNTITSIGSYAFYDCYSLTNITIPEGVTFIGSYAFYYCDSLTSITIPEGVTSIEDYTFYYCSSLKFITIPNSVTSIGLRIIEGCDLAYIFIPSSVLIIEYWAFYNCIAPIYCEAESKPDGWDYGWTTNPNAVHWGCVLGTTNDFSYVAQNQNQIKQVAILKYIGTDAVISIPSQISVGGESLPVVSIGSYAFDDCNFVTSVSLPDSVTSIGDCAFYNCYSLTNITIPEGVTFIGSDAFYYCSSLVSIIIPVGVTIIEFATFYNCSALSSVTIPSSVDYIGRYSFYNCSSLTQIGIPDGVERIGSSAFEKCSSLSLLDLSTCDYVVDVEDSSFLSGTSEALTIKVKSDLVDEYKTARYWKNYADKIVGV